jgi:23S rRNA (cytosine1962-C5)-methyltransferase
VSKEKVTLKPGKEKALLNRHHWIFSGAIASAPSSMHGNILAVHSSKGDLIGHAYFNSKAKIIGRMVSWGEDSPQETVLAHLKSAIQLRKSFFDDKITNAYRLVNGEGDFIPGLVIDKYADGLVIQISTLGMEKLKPLIINYLIQHLKPAFIYEKSNLPSRKEEGLEPHEKMIHGQSDSITILENGLKFLVSPEQGQKTGFFLDHRDMRQHIRELSKGKRVLNCFAYTGGFSIYAASGGATLVDSVDLSEIAMEFAEKNAEINQFSIPMNFYVSDVFQYLRESPLDYDIVILDPPAFAKRQKDIIPACRGYKDINRIAMQKMPAGSLLLTSSCSYFVDEELFQKVVFQAAVEAKREVRIIGRHRLAVDHPLNIFHPEGDYLKSLLLYLVS